MLYFFSAIKPQVAFLASSTPQSDKMIPFLRNQVEELERENEDLREKLKVRISINMFCSICMWDKTSQMLQNMKLH